MKGDKLTTAMRRLMAREKPSTNIEDRRGWGLQDPEMEALVKGPLVSPYKGMTLDQLNKERDRLKKTLSRKRSANVSEHQANERAQYFVAAGRHPGKTK